MSKSGTHAQKYLNTPFLDEYWCGENVECNFLTAGKSNLGSLATRPRLIICDAAVVTMIPVGSLNTWLQAWISIIDAEIFAPNMWQ